MDIGALVISIGCVQILTLVLCGVLWWCLLRQERTIHNLRTRYATTQSEASSSEGTAEEDKSFHSEYREAEIRASLQTAGSTRHSPTEKYKYVACMADKGLGVDDLARSFGISSYEAEQLVNLSRLANGTQS
ncbi:MAG: hypothetical protein K9J48_01820 [Desulfohalobiaceae bacterium]|nr:hypothetical protein [Desulfohalobiaceae bacterium]MCF8085608.1 hypothetical protein [Desulfohalobiaceae bacterium]